MNKPKLIMLIGLPGSGKSAYAKRLSEKYLVLNKNIVIFSSDNIREELYDINDVEHNSEVFAAMNKRTKEALQNGVNVIYDATNINRKKRIALLNYLQKINCQKEAVVIATPYEACIKNNSERERNVPEFVIKRMRERFQFPCYGEGWDDIKFHWNLCDMKFRLDELIDTMWVFNQRNEHHEYSLGKHCIKTVNNMKNGSNLALTNKKVAAMFHDIGKLDTQEFYDFNGNPTVEAHYYHHANVGAYNMMFYLKDNYNPYELDYLNICLLIELHMHPFWWDRATYTEKQKKKDLQLFGKDMINDLNELHHADVISCR